MGNTAIFDEVQTFNLSYLLLAQKLLREDRLSAKYRLHWDDEVADLVLGLGTEQLVTLSSSSQVLTALALDAHQLTILTSNVRAPDQSSLHAAILLSNLDAKAGRLRGEGE
jgi:flagellar transcriptional activator FlhD